MSKQFAEAFSEMRPWNERQIALAVADAGDIEDIKRDDHALRKLFETHERFPGRTSAPSGANLGSRPDSDGSSKQSRQASFERFKVELNQDITATLQANFMQFQEQLISFQNKLSTDLQDFIRRENNRLVDKISDGPHVHIHDKVCMVFVYRGSSSQYLIFSQRGRDFRLFGVKWYAASELVNSLSLHTETEYSITFQALGASC